MRVTIWKSDFRDFPGLLERLKEKSWTIFEIGNYGVTVKVDFLHPCDGQTHRFIRWLYYGIDP